MKSIGLPLDAEEQEKVAEDDDVFSTTAVWPASPTSARSGHADDDMSVHSLHGYDLEK